MKSSTFSLSTAIEIRNHGATILTHAEAIAEALSALDATLQTFAEDRGIDEMQAVITATRNLADATELHAERVTKLRHARSYLDHGGKLVPTGGARPW